MRMKTVLAVVSCAACINWTRFVGRVKGINLRDSTVTIQNKDGDLLTIPVDFQVRISDKGGDPLTLKNLVLDEKITLINTPAEKPKDETFSEMNSQK